MSDVMVPVEDRIRELHAGIVSSMRRSVSDAIEIGGLISTKKEELAHGEFLPWVAGLSFTYKTAERYVGLYRYRLKIDNVSNLTEAYRVAQIEDNRVKGKEEKPKPMPAKPIQSDDEYRQKKEEWEAEIKAEKHRPLGDIFDDIKELVVKQEKDEIFRDFDVDGLIDELRRRVMGVGDVHRRHEVVSSVIKAMREIAVECERLSV